MVCSLRVEMPGSRRLSEATSRARPSALVATSAKVSSRGPAVEGTRTGAGAVSVTLVRSRPASGTVSPRAASSRPVSGRTTTVPRHLWYAWPSAVRTSTGSAGAPS